MKSAIAAILAALTVVFAIGAAEPPGKETPEVREACVVLIGKGSVRERPPLVRPDQTVESAAADAAGGSAMRFGFYEAPSGFRSTVRVGVTSDAITLTNLADRPSGPVAVLVNDGLSRNGARVGSIPPREEVTLSRAGMTEVSWDDRETLDAAGRVWRGAGLNDADATAAVAVWREELLHRPGFLVISQLPIAAHEKAFPAAAKRETPRRARVGVIFDTVEGQPERLDWLVNLDRSTARWVKQFGGSDPAAKAAAFRELSAVADLAGPFLQELANDKDAAVATAAKELLKQPSGSIDTSPHR